MGPPHHAIVAAALILIPNANGITTTSPNFDRANIGTEGFDNPNCLVSHLEAAIFYISSKRSSRLCFRAGVLGRNHSGCRLTIAPRNCSNDEPVPKDFEIHRTR